MVAARASVGVLGGSGFYAFLDDAVDVSIDTPWGPTSSPITVGEIGTGTDTATSVAFIARHGRHHQHLPHEVPARANLWALHQIGVRQVIGPCTVGSLRKDFVPGDFVVLDQIVDRTSGRPATFFERSGNSLSHTFHLSFADPYCPSMRTVAIAAGSANKITVHTEGTVVVINGPRFSTRAESRWYRKQGWDVVNMTQTPEAVLAAELGMCYCGVALVTDFDSGVEDDPDVTPVTATQVFDFFKANIDQVRSLLNVMIPNLRYVSECDCASRSGPISSLPSD